MSTRFPDADTVRTVLELAIRAPSIYNTQPWKWRVEPTSLHLYSDSSMQLPNADPDGRDLLVSCGATLHHCVIALAAMGWRAEVRRFPDPSDPEHLAAVEVTEDEPDADSITLAAAIPRRRTDRRTYSHWPVEADGIAAVGAAGTRPGVIMRQVDAMEKLNKIVKQAARDHAANYDYLVEVTMWSGRYGSRAGVPSRNTPESDAHAPVPGRRFASAGLEQPKGVSAADDHAVVLALGTETDDRPAALCAGEATSAVLLTATAMGLATCPITEPLEIPATRDAIRTEVFGADAFPQMLLRIGWAPVNADPLPPTPRRSLERAVHWSE